MLLDRAGLDLVLQGLGLIGDEVNLLLVLLLLILDLGKFVGHSLYFSLECLLLVLLLLDSRSKLFDFHVVGFLLLLVKECWVVLDLLFFHLLEGVDGLGDDVDIF